ncbi:hypothetical protein ENH_00070840 [Eimeria necatrix]|uniref:Uncharacterized protein n=1 Tax=Eimeria necatrix TaxID=51315 RepID=U6N041_9EIME|nr:hypothetical protein ENH_00070840 [Eimeria necatrix]CDJ69562.1 hypothetical protein ENH_00070840 [Eimeria necatrix]
MKTQISFFFLFCLAVSASGEGEERPFRFEPRPPQTGALKTFHPLGGGKEEAELYSAATFPNPFVEPERCAFAARKNHSWLCDPQRLLPPQEEAELELALLRLRDLRAHECADGKLHHFQQVGSRQQELPRWNGPHVRQKSPPRFPRWPSPSELDLPSLGLCGGGADNGGGVGGESAAGGSHGCVNPKP